MNVLFRILRKIKRLYYKYYKNRVEINKICRLDDEFINIVRKALVSTKKNELTLEESRWIDKIENLRQRLKNSSKRIEFIDFGAGSSKDQLSDEEMYKGRKSIVSVSNVCQASVPYIWGLLLFKVIKNFKPEVCLELGTFLGISTSFLASALEINKKGKIITIEGAPSYAKIAKENLYNLGLTNVTVKTGRFQDILDEILEEIKEVSYVFIDGHHDEFATINYHKKIMPYLQEKAILVYDDINWSKGMKRAWDTIKKDKSINFSIDLFKLGICIISPQSSLKKNFTYYLK